MFIFVFVFVFAYVFVFAFVFAYVFVFVFVFVFEFIFELQFDFFKAQFIFHLLPPLLRISSPFLIDLSLDRDSFPRSG